MLKKKIVIATRNLGKFKELSELLKINNKVEYFPVSDFNIADPEETGKTFIDNAILKSKFASEKTGLPAIADDSGLEIFSLGGFPGVFSSRCAGENASDSEKMKFVLEKMKNITDRRARFVSAVSFSEPDNIDFPVFFTGYCYGIILSEPQGVSKPGLQYDSIFYYPPLKRTFAKLSSEVKNSISHRFFASNGMTDFLRRFLWLQTMIDQFSLENNSK